MRMRQETFKKSYYIPAFGKSIEIRRNQDIDEEGVLGKELLAQYGEDCILEGETKSLMEKVASGDIGGSLTTEQTDAIEKINGLQSSASKIDDLVQNGAEKNKLISKLKEANRIDIVGDSIFYGVGVFRRENSFILNLKKKLAFNGAITNVGFVSANNSNPTITEHIIEVSDITKWTPKYSNSSAINNYSYDCSTAGSTISFTSQDYEQTTFTLSYVKPSVTSIYEVWVNGVLIDTINESSVGASVFKESNAYALGLAGNIIQVKLVSGSISISGVRYSDGTQKVINNYCTGGRRAVYMRGDIIPNTLLSDVCIWNLGYNDIQNGSNQAQKDEVFGYLTTLAEHFIANNKVFIYVNTVWDTALIDNWLLQKLLSLFGSYEHFYNLDYRGTIIDGTGAIGSTTYRKNTLKEWGDDAHPNAYGSERMYRYVCKRIFNEYINGTEKAIEYVSNSLVSNKSALKGGANYAVLLGEGNSLARSYGVMIGSFGNSIHSSIVFGQSTTNLKKRQYEILLRHITTNDAVETYLRDTAFSAIVYTNTNTLNILSGTIIAHNPATNTIREFIVDCIIRNVDGVNTLIMDTGYPINGITQGRGSLAVTAKVYGGANNSYTLRVTGIAGTTINWTSTVEVTQITVGY